MSNARAVLNDLGDKYMTGLSLTNNDVIWLNDMCLRLCRLLRVYDPTLTMVQMLVTLNPKHFQHAIPRIELLSTVRKTFLNDGPNWHTITMLEMNKCISVFNAIVDYIHEYAPEELLHYMCEVQEDIKFPEGTGRKELCAILCMRKFGYFRNNISTVKAKGA